MTGPPKRLDVKRVLKQLRQLKLECRDEQLSTECAMIVAVMAAIQFYDAFDTGPRQKWSSFVPNMGKTLRNLQHALDLEFEAGNKAAVVSTDTIVGTPVASGNLPNTLAILAESK